MPRAHRRPIPALAAAVLVTCACPAYGALADYAERVWHYGDGLPEETVQAFRKRPTIFCGSAPRRTGSIRRRAVRVFDHDNTPALHESSIFCLLAAADGTLWIGTEGRGVASYRNQRSTRGQREGLTNGYCARCVRTEPRHLDGNG